MSILFSRQLFYEAMVSRQERFDEAKRSKYIGASEIGDCMRKVGLKKIGLKVDGFKHQKSDMASQRRMFLGNLLEGVIVDTLKRCGVDIKNTGEDQLEVPHAIANIIAHPDGTIAGISGPIAVEIKALGRDVWKEMDSKMMKAAHVREVIGDAYYLQIISQMSCLGSKLGLFVAMNRDSGEILALDIYYNEDAERDILDRAEQIMLFVNGQDHDPNKLPGEPALGHCWHCPYKSICSDAKYKPKAVDEDVVEEVHTITDDNELIQAVEALADINDAIKQLETAADSLKPSILKRILDKGAGAGVTTESGVVAMVKRRKTSRIDTDRLKREKAEIYRDYLVEGESEYLQVKRLKEK